MKSYKHVILYTTKSPPHQTRVLNLEFSKKTLLSKKGGRGLQIHQKVGTLWISFYFQNYSNQGLASHTLAKIPLVPLNSNIRWLDSPTQLANIKQF